MSNHQLIDQKVNEIIVELKQLRLWKPDIPGWVIDYAKRPAQTADDFTEWLQFIFLPNVQYSSSSSAQQATTYVVPQAMKFLPEELLKGRLLQLLVELDSLA